MEFDANYQEFALILSDNFGIPIKQIYAYYAASNMFEPDDLIDAHVIVSGDLVAKRQLVRGENIRRTVFHYS